MNRTEKTFFSTINSIDLTNDQDAFLFSGKFAGSHKQQEFWFAMSFSDTSGKFYSLLDVSKYVNVSGT